MLFEKGRKFHVGEGVEQDLTQALAYYKQALKRDENLYAALYNSGLIYHAQENYARAHPLFIKAAFNAFRLKGVARLQCISYVVILAAVVAHRRLLVVGKQQDKSMRRHPAITYSESVR